MSKNSFIAIITICLLGSSCFPPAPKLSFVLLDSQSFPELSLSKDELKNVQYFLCGHVLLEREVDSPYGVQFSSTHKVIPREGKYIEQIEILPQTPGISREIGPRFEYIDIAFDPKTPNETIRFTLNSSRYYEISTSLTKGILYEGHDFVNKDNIPARLCIEKDSLKNLRKKTKILPGIKLKKQENSTPKKPG